MPKKLLRGGKFAKLGNYLSRMPMPVFFRAYILEENRNTVRLRLFREIKFCEFEKR